MKRYISVVGAYFRGSLMNQMEYKFNFLTGGTFELVWMVMYIVFIDVLFLHTEGVNGWNKYQMLMLTFQGGLMDSVFTFCVVPGLRRLPEMISTGTLDFLLLKPICPRFAVSFHEFDIPQLKNVFLNVFGILYCVRRLNLSVTPLKFAVYLLLSVNGFLLIYSILFLLMSLAFWWTRMDIVMGIGSELITVGNKPMSIYPRAVQKFLIYGIPVLVCFNFPILYLVRGLEISLLGYAFFSNFLFFFLSHRLFQRGLRRYNSAGS